VWEIYGPGYPIFKKLQHELWGIEQK
jgi:hypothetical protein